MKLLSSRTCPFDYIIQLKFMNFNFKYYSSSLKCMTSVSNAKGQRDILLDQENTHTLFINDFNDFNEFVNHNRCQSK